MGPKFPCAIFVWTLVTYLVSFQPVMPDNPQGKEAKYTVINPLKNVTVVEGTSIFLTCNTSLQPSSIHWLQDGKFLPKQGNHHIITQAGELYIRNIKSHHSGLYSCLAANSRTEDLSKPISLGVQIPAEIIEGPEDRNISFGHTITTYCVSVGDPIPRIYWVRNGAIVIEEGTARRYYGAKLLLNVTSVMEITCHAYNNLVDGIHRAYKTGIVRPIIVVFPTKKTEKAVITTPSPKIVLQKSGANFGSSGCREGNPKCLTKSKYPNPKSFSQPPTHGANKSRTDNPGVDQSPTSSRTVITGRDYFPPLTFVLLWAGFPLLVITFSVLSWIGCRKCIVDKLSPFRCHNGGPDQYEDVIHSTIRAGGTLAHIPGADISQDSIRRIFVSDLPINQTYYNKICPNQAIVEAGRGKEDHRFGAFAVYHSKDRSHISLNERPNGSATVIEYPRNNIIYVRDLGQGAFGHVFQAKAPSLVIDPEIPGIQHSDVAMVAVKMIKDGMEGDHELEEDFAREAKLMSHFNHPNILRLLAMCSVGKPLCLLLEYMCNGDLHHFLRKNSPVPTRPDQQKFGNDTDYHDYETSSVSPYFFETDVVGTFEKLLASTTSCKSKRLFPHNACKIHKCKQQQQHRQRSDDSSRSKTYQMVEPPSLSVYELLYIAQQIATGMLYLSSRYFIHRDLAARNCLVGPHLTIKISDFGLCRRISSSPSRSPHHNKGRNIQRARAPSLAECNASDDSGKDYYTTLRVRKAVAIPIRWMPPEAIVWNEFSVASDIWSMGIVMWEIFTFSLQPYFWLKNNEEIIHFLRAGRRLPKPKFMPATVYKSVVMECWKGKACHRPSFRKIYDTLIRIETELRLTSPLPNYEL